MDHHIIGHNVGIRPSRKSGVRVEKEFRNGQKIVHAYGTFRIIFPETLERPLYLTNSFTPRHSGWWLHIRLRSRTRS